MAKFEEEKVINTLHPERAEIGKKYWFSDRLLDLKDYVVDDEHYKCYAELTGINIDCNACFIMEGSYPYCFIYPYEEPKYRPYTDTEEMINDFCERSGAKRSKMGEPFIWVKPKDDSTKVLMTHIDKYYIGEDYMWNMQQFFDKYTYLDGSPCGKEIK